MGFGRLHHLPTNFPEFVIVCRGLGWKNTGRLAGWDDSVIDLELNK